MAEKEKSVYDVLSKIDMSGHTEKKKTGSTELMYLSWPVAWAAVVERYPDADYGYKSFGENQLPYTFDPLTGYMVYTYVTIGGQTRNMWLPVMDSHNAAMKDKPYEVKTKYGSYTVGAATMTDINKAIMRCFVKNLAMFGLGLNFFAGEEKIFGNIGEDANVVDADGIKTIKNLMKKMGWKDESSVAKYFKVATIDKMTQANLEQFKAIVEKEEKKKATAPKDMDDVNGEGKDADDTQVLPEDKELSPAS